MIALALVVAALLAPPRPHIVWKPIPYGPQRKAEMADYARRHYGIHTWRLNPKVIVEHYTATPTFSSVYDTFSLLEVRRRSLGTVTSVEAQAGVNGLTVSPDRRQIAIGLWRGDRLQLVVAEMPRAGDRTLRIVRTLRSLPDPSIGYSLIWR